MSFILIALAGMLNAAYEILFVGFNQSIFSNFKSDFWNPMKSWKNKWAIPYPQHMMPYWWYFGFYPRYKERFPYSSTLFVWLTDAWHLFKALMLACIMLAIVSYSVVINPFVDFILLYVTFTFVFTIFFEYIFRKSITKL
jgi:hypothetical protein